jgi:hypothetical protein
MDDFTLQCLYQNKADFEANRISKDTYINTLLSLFKHKSSGYINSEEYILYPNVLPPICESEEGQKEETLLCEELVEKL